MTSLRALHKSMLQIDVNLQQFRVATGAADFDCLFSTRESPYTLAMTSRGIKPQFLLFPVTSGYRIAENLGPELYQALLSVLRIDGRSRRGFRPFTFLNELNGKIPTEAKPQSVPDQERIISLRSDITEERKRPYFSHWRRNDLRGAKVSQENLHKTRLLFGPDAYEYSLSNNLSSCWSPVPTKRGWRGDQV